MLFFLLLFFAVRLNCGFSFLSLFSDSIVTLKN